MPKTHIKKTTTLVKIIALTKKLRRDPKRSPLALTGLQIQRFFDSFYQGFARHRFREVRLTSSRQ